MGYERKTRSTKVKIKIKKNYQNFFLKNFYKKK